MDEVYLNVLSATLSKYSFGQDSVLLNNGFQLFHICRQFLVPFMRVWKHDIEYEQEMVFLTTRNVPKEFEFVFNMQKHEHGFRTLLLKALTSCLRHLLDTLCKDETLNEAELLRWKENITRSATPFLNQKSRGGYWGIFIYTNDDQTMRRTVDSLDFRPDVDQKSFCRAFSFYGSVNRSLRFINSIDFVSDSISFS